jgi:hypothetical protein
MIEREEGFYWVRIIDEWTIGEWCDNNWWVVGCDSSWRGPGLRRRERPRDPELDEIGPRIESYTGSEQPEGPNDPKAGIH